MEQLWELPSPDPSTSITPGSQWCPGSSCYLQAGWQNKRCNEFPPLCCETSLSLPFLEILFLFFFQEAGKEPPWMSNWPLGSHQDCSHCQTLTAQNFPARSIGLVCAIKSRLEWGGGRWQWGAEMTAGFFTLFPGIIPTLENEASFAICPQSSLCSQLWLCCWSS